MFLIASFAPFQWASGLVGLKSDLFRKSTLFSRSDEREFSTSSSIHLHGHSWESDAHAELQRSYLAAGFAADKR